MGAMNASIGDVAAVMAGFAMRSAIAAIFVIAALHALRDRDTYAQIVHAYRIVPDRFAEPFAVVLPFVECAIALALVLPAARFPGSLAALALLACFTAAIGLNLARGRRDIACGCGGGTSQKISGALVLRNAVLFAGLAASLAAPVHPRLHLAGYVGIAGLASFLSVIYLAANQLMANAHAMQRIAGARA